MEAYSGILHRYAPPLVAFEFSKPTNPPSLSLSSPSTNTLLFVGGLFDNLLTVPFANALVESLPDSWCLVQAALSSSGIGWGTSNLDKDVSELAQLVTYIRRLRPDGKVALLGHSTGSQDTVHYIVSQLKRAGQPKLDGGIIQAPASDREGLPSYLGEKLFAESVIAAQKLVAAGTPLELLSRAAMPEDKFPPLTAERWLSLASPAPDHAGQDDMFSSDLPDDRLQKTFGEIARSKTPFLILFMGEDQFVPKTVDKVALVNRWIKTIKQSDGNVHDESGVVPGMDHTGSGAPAQALADMTGRIVKFLESL